MMKRDAVAGGDDDRKSGQHQSGAAPPIGSRSPSSTATIVASRAGHQREHLHEGDGERRDRRPRDGRRRSGARSRPAARQHHQHGKAGVSENERAEEPQPEPPYSRRPFPRSRSRCKRRRQHVAGAFEPEQMDEHTTKVSSTSTIHASIAPQRCAPARGHRREQGQRAQQDQRGVAW